MLGEKAAIQTVPFKAAALTVKEATVVCVKLPLVPVTLTLNVPVGPFASVVKVSVERAVPPEVTKTLVRLNLQPGQLGHARFGEVARLTVPLNPFRLVTVIDDVALVPG